MKNEKKRTKNVTKKVTLNKEKVKNQDKIKKNI